FRVSQIPDGGSFAHGDAAALAWDIRHEVRQAESVSKIDLSACTHIKPYATACLCAIGLTGRRLGREVEIIPPENQSCRDHLARLGLPGFFKCDWTLAGEVRDTNIQASHVEWPPGDESDRIMEVLAPRANLPSGIFSEMVSGLDEIILNALTHSGSPI